MRALAVSRRTLAREILSTRHLGRARYQTAAFVANVSCLVPQKRRARPRRSTAPPCGVRTRACTAYPCPLTHARAQLRPSRLQDLAFEDLLDAGQDLRLDLAYTDFYRDQGDVNAALPSPLDTDTLFNNIAKKLLEQSEPIGEQRAANAGVQQLAYQIVQGAPLPPWWHATLPDLQACT